MSDSYERAGTLGFRCARDAVVTPRAPGCTPALCVTLDATPGVVDLTALGAAPAGGGGDWAKWGYGGAAPGGDRRAGGSGAIGCYYGIGGAVVAGYVNNPSTFTWSDGAPHVAGAGQGTGVYTTTGGFGLDVALAPAGGTLLVFVGAWGGGRGRINVTRSDGAAPAYIDASLVAPAGAPASVAYRVDAGGGAAGGGGVTLHVEWTIAGGGADDEDGAGNITLQGAAVTDGAAACAIMRPTQPVCA